MGDEGPRNNTETSAIFAGTGSEIKLGPKQPDDGDKSSARKDRKRHLSRLKEKGLAKKVKNVDSKCGQVSIASKLDRDKGEGERTLIRSKESTSNRNVWAIGEVDLRGKRPLYIS